MRGSPWGINCTPCGRPMKTKRIMGDIHCRKKKMEIFVSQDSQLNLCQNGASKRKGVLQTG